MNHAFLIKYGEIALKGKNRRTFEESLMKQIKFALAGLDAEFVITNPTGRIFIESADDFDVEDAIDALQHVFGIVGICPAVLIEDEGFDDLAQKLVAYVDEQYPDKNFTFKVEARRARKNYPMNSMELNAALGEKLLDAFPTLKVDVHQPEVMVHVEIR